MNGNTRQISLSALFLALCVLVPIVFHFLNLGKALLPMFLPILLAAFILNYPYGIIVGLAGPWVSALVTGMPPVFPTAVVMSAEGLAATFIISYLYKKREANFWISLSAAIIGERLTFVLMLFLILPIFGIPPEAVTVGAVISLPGIALQFFLVPLTLKALEKRNIIETI